MGGTHSGPWDDHRWGTLAALRPDVIRVVARDARGISVFNGSCPIHLQKNSSYTLFSPHIHVSFYARLYTLSFHTTPAAVPTPCHYPLRPPPSQLIFRSKLCCLFFLFGPGFAKIAEPGFLSPAQPRPKTSGLCPSLIRGTYTFSPNITTEFKLANPMEYNTR